MYTVYPGYNSMFLEYQLYIYKLDTNHSTLIYTYLISIASESFLFMMQPFNHASTSEHNIHMHEKMKAVIQFLDKHQIRKSTVISHLKSCIHYEFLS